MSRLRSHIAGKEYISFNVSLSCSDFIFRVCGSDVHTISSDWGEYPTPMIVGYVNPWTFRI